MKESSESLKTPRMEAVDYFPAWVVYHVPHDSTWIPESLRDQFVLDDDALAIEVLRMTDHHTLRLFVQESIPAAQVVRAEVSRLVVDVERFSDDRFEPMAGKGMGAIYGVSSQLEPLRRNLSPAERADLMSNFYHPHHALLDRAVESMIASHGHCLILDCHSFPSEALPYEDVAAKDVRPDICIGTDSYHTSTKLADAFFKRYEQAGWNVSMNSPFAGALVPASKYRTDSRVSSVMIEVNRRIYLDEATGRPLPQFDEVALRVQSCCREAISDIESSVTR